jgi:lysozyme
MDAPEIEQAVAIASALCKRFEGFRARPYLCPAGVATIGYGSTFYENGVRVSLRDDPISEARASELLAFVIRRKFLREVVQACPGADSPGRFAALLDFTYNLGAGNLRSSTLRRRVNAGEWSDVPAQLLRWNKAGGRILPGLTARRIAEGALI